MSQAEAGKGSKSRPFSVSYDTFSQNFDNIFRKKDMNTQQTQPKKGTCGCGRSPTGNCIGWHALSEEAYKKKLAEHLEKTLDKKQ